MDQSLLISIIALATSIVGWAVSYLFGVRASNIGRKKDFQLKIYFGLLNRTNELIQVIASYTTNTISHTNAMAKLLNEYVSDELRLDTLKNIERKHELKLSWLDAAYQLSEESFTVQRSIEDYLRYLDMNGTDYTSGTKVFDALQTLKRGAYRSAENNRERWNNPSEMDKISVKQYKKKSIETKRDADNVFDFGMCLDDVLLHMYNASIAEYLGKPKKELEAEGRRYYVTLAGIIDSRDGKKKGAK